MNREIPHIVLTRFNLAIKFECRKRGDSEIPMEKPWLNEEYLKRRFEIFEKYTFPSFLDQTNQDFEWIVLFHKDTPELYKKKIKDYSKKMRQFNAWFLDDSECEKCGEILERYIAEKYFNSVIITTRVDNDDVVHRTFLESIKKEFLFAKQSEILTYVNGLQYDSRNRDVMKYNYVNNHFLSLYVTDTKEKNHILLFNHTLIDKEIVQRGIKKIEKVSQIPLWVEIITETNFSNAPRWRFSSVFVLYEIKEEYQLLELKWDKKIQWMWCSITGIGKVLINRGRGLYRIILRKN